MGILFKSAHTRGGFGEDITLHDLTLDNVSVAVRINMNWNPSYSYATIPPGSTQYPPYWTVLATPVAEALGRAHFRDVHVSHIRGTAKTAFEVSGYPSLPLDHFTFSGFDLQNPDRRPWVAGFVALPSSYLLMIASFSVSCTYQRLVHHRVFVGHWPTGHEGFPLLLCHMLLLIAWSWTAGCVVGSVSRRTLWASAVLAAVPALLMLCTPGWWLCFFLFLPAAVLGVWRGWKGSRTSFRAAFLLALTMTVLMIFAQSHEALWPANWALLCPALYLVARAWRSGPDSRAGFWLMRHLRVQ